MRTLQELDDKSGALFEAVMQEFVVVRYSVHQKVVVPLQLDRSLEAVAREGAGKQTDRRVLFALKLCSSPDDACNIN